MSRPNRPLELALPERPAAVPIQRWFYDEIRRAILDGRLRRGERLPSKRALAASDGVARG